MIVALKFVFFFNALALHVRRREYSHHQQLMYAGVLVPSIWPHGPASVEDGSNFGLPLDFQLRF